MWLMPIVFLTTLILLLAMMLEFCLSSGIFFSQALFIVSLNSSNISVLFLFFVGLISLTVFLWGYTYMDSKFNLVAFSILLFSFVLSMMVLILSNSLFLIFLGWEGLGISSFALILFYQNWMSSQGAILTLLTNRIGDAVLLLVFSYWLISQQTGIFKFSSSLFMVSLILVAFTKSAQWPFISWLPAAMAAPTPVSALVHSSTLVTAGIWLMIRFSMNNLLFSSIWFFFGLLTLLVASLAAMTEMDTKKIVALSTLSQLGMMFLAFSTGNVFICLFHVLSHALAKANLFMIVGNLLHSSFAQQDSRQIISNYFNKTFFISMIVSLMSLIGVIFISGFFSKEQILTSHYSVFNSVLFWWLLLMVIGLTFSYCFNFLMKLCFSNTHTLISNPIISGLNTYPILILTLLSIGFGWVSLNNLSAYSLMPLSPYGFYWNVLLSGIVLLWVSQYQMMAHLFNAVSSLNRMLISLFYKSKNPLMNLENSTLESFYLSISVHTSILFKQNTRMISSILCILILLSLF